MSRWVKFSCCQFFVVVPIVDGHYCRADGFGNRQPIIDRTLRDDRQSGSERAVIKAGVEDGGAEPLGSDAVAVRLRDAGDEPVQAQASQVVCDRSSAFARAVEPDARGDRCERMCPGREQTEARRAIMLGPADQRSATPGAREA